MNPVGIYADYLSAPHDIEGHRWMWYSPLCDLGYRIEHFDRLQRDAGELLADVDRLRPAFVFFMPVNDEYPPALLEELRDRDDVVTIAWGSDDNWRWDDYSRHVAPLYNLYVTTYRESYQEALRSGMRNVMLSQWGADCRSFYKSGALKDLDVVCIGKVAGDGVTDGRTELIERMAAADFGFEWRDPCGGMPVAEQNMLVNSARIVLAPQRGVNGLPQIKARVFENAATGTFVLAERHPHLAEFYEPGFEMATWNTAEEAVTWVNYYLAHEDERERIAAAGRRRTVRQHRMDQRLAEVLCAAWLPVPGGEWCRLVG